MEQTTLYYRQGSSDKVYQAILEPSGEKYVIKFAYGRRGATMQVGTKTPTAVNLTQAKAIYERLINEKLAKGYSPGEAGTPYQQTDNASRSTETPPQLLNPVGEEDLPKFISDASWVMQEKFDGRRMLIRKTGSEIVGVSRKGLIVPLPTLVVNEVMEIPGDVTLDGESIGDIYWVFDLLHLHGNDIRIQPYKDRLFALQQIISQDFGFIKLVETARNVAEKAAMLEYLRKHHREGVVFKKLNAPYTAGRPASGGNQRKLKFYATASFIVGTVNGKRSVPLHLLDGKSLVPAGNVTIPPNHAVPPSGSVVEVRYLYAFKESGSVYQPTYLGQRDDIDAADCTVSQLKWKPAEEVEA